MLGQTGPIFESERNNTVEIKKRSVLQSILIKLLGPDVARDVKWFNVVFLSILHAIFVWSVLNFPYIRRWKVILWVAIGGMNGFGITGGVHRLWSHRSYKATLPLRIILMICFTMAGQNPIHDWVRDHRVHHKYTETSADPHNAKRGFFFSHVGWLMMRKHPDVIRRGKEIDMDDVLADPVVQFHVKHFSILKMMLAFIIPSIVPPLLFGEDWFWSIVAICVYRYCCSLNFTWFVNSAAHLWGYKPYDKKINPSENLGVSIVTMGEGWHNYHHTFPWDYKAAELGNYSFNLTTFWIDMFAKIGWAYDLRAPSRQFVERVIMKTGDGSHSISRLVTK
ncbi:acyl-CoA Delta(11) desaturase-like isoform X2 [Photinus pyralis]|uniref:acyl-CoA Delta(11) desaturase-like isoform X2 n=1 Tax=Photinus pyralis TaxID=7054 RepID=UPI001266E923|nr:acyl-CoA Delta(11) desaturase-like isoform X2 [Photinus pyralis]